MGVMAVNDIWVSRLGLAFKAEGALMMSFPILAYTVKFGMVWHDAGPPFGPTTFNWYFNMILAVYWVLGAYMFAVGKDPVSHKSLIGFFIWSSVAHLAVLIAMAIMDDTPSYAGPIIGGFELPARVMGIAHWQNISPVGDVMLMFVLITADMFLAYKAFGSVLLPTDL